VSGYGYDTETLTLVVILPDGEPVRVVGENDGVNGFTWTASRGADALEVRTDHRVLIDGITEEDDDEAKERATCSRCLARTYRNEECVCEDGGDAEDYDEVRGVPMKYRITATGSLRASNDAEAQGAIDAIARMLSDGDGELGRDWTIDAVREDADELEDRAAEIADALEEIGWHSVADDVREGTPLEVVASRLRELASAAEIEDALAIVEGRT
jgi:hypothetical protein